MVGVGLGAGTGKDGERWREGWTEEATTKEGWWGGQEEWRRTGWTGWRRDGGEGTGKEGEEHSW